jgi:hypothetical protein
MREDNIKMNFREIRLSVMDCINLAWDGFQWWDVVNTGMNPGAPIN